MNLKSKNILVMGLGKSGKACVKFLQKNGAIVTAADSSQEILCKDELLNLGIKLELGAHNFETIKNSDLIVLSPGVPLNIPALKFARENKIEIIGEIELASRFIKKTKIIAITGSNGKTTTTMLISKMLEAASFSVFTCGNIGTPLIEYDEEKDKKDYIVLELSSFQLDTIKTFRPDISVLLNITQDHIDRYESFEDYRFSKLRIFENQTEADCAIVKKELSSEFDLEKKIKAEIIPLDTDFNPANIKIDTNKFIGRHNRENIYAASFAALRAGAKQNHIQKALDDFKMPLHRIEFAGEKNGVKFYDDSKGTNPDASLKAIESFDDNIILIMGGLSKGEDYSVLKEAIKKKVKKLILMGASKDKMESLFSDLTDTIKVDSMAIAVQSAKKAALKGDVVLLSPAAASFDMYKSYAHRGDVFKMEVQKNGNQ